MFFGCCVNMLPRDELAGASYARELAELGFDYIELPLNRIVTLSEGDYDRLRGTVEDSGLPCRCCNDFLPREYRLVGPETTDPDVLRRYLETGFSRIGRGGLGARYAVFGSPWSRSCPEGFSPARALEQIGAFLTLAAETAEGYGVTIAVEHNNRSETNTLNTITAAAELVRQLDRPNVGILCDYYHLRVEGTPAGDVAACGNRIVHTHIARLAGRSFLDSLEGEEDFLLPYAAALRGAAYAGGVSLEGFIPDRESFRRLAGASLVNLRAVFG